MELYVINGTESHLLSLKKNTKINLSIYNPMFNNVGLFSQLITVYRAENDRFFNYAAQLQSLISVNLQFKLTFGTDTVIEGDVKVTDSDDNAIEFYLKSGNSSVAVYIQNILMSDAPFWGDYTTPVDFAETLDGNYPEYPFVVPPIAGPDNIVYNYQRVLSIQAVVYLRFLLDKIISGLGYNKNIDDLDINPDLSRVGLLAPSFYFKKDYTDKTTAIGNHLPDISIKEFLDDVLFRYNAFIFFSPITFDADILLIDDIIQMSPDDWTFKFKSTVKLAPTAEKIIILTNDTAEKSDLLTPTDIIEQTTPITVATINDLPSSRTTDIYYVTAEDRFYQQIRYSNPEPLLPDGAKGEYYEFSNDDLDDIPDTYKVIKPIPDTPTAGVKTNTDTSAVTDNLIAQFFLENVEGEIEDNLYVSIKAQVNNGSATLKAKAFLRNTPALDETYLGEKQITVTTTSPTNYGFRFKVAPMQLGNRIGELIIRFYCKSDTAGKSISLFFGGDYNGNYAYSILRSDDTYDTWREYGRLKNISYGESLTEKPITIKPTSTIPFNTIAAAFSFVTEMPLSTLERKEKGERENFEWLVYRGRREANQTPGHYVAYCNYDNHDLDLEDYTNKLQPVVEPQLTLKWEGEKGLANQLFKNRLPWERYLKRRVSMDMQLTFNDIFNRPIYKPFSVQGSNIIAEKITLTIDVFDNITNQRIEGYTL